MQSKLKEAGIPYVVYYPKSLTQRSRYIDSTTVSTGLRVSDDLLSKVLSLPIRPYLPQVSQA